MKKSKVYLRLFRNRYGIHDVDSKPNRVNLEYSHTVNIGDTLSPIIVEWMLKKKGLSLDSSISGFKHLMAVGSVIGRGRFDTVLWGTGILSDSVWHALKVQRLYGRKYDIRAVRGPRTAQALRKYGYDCPDVYGDPAVLMPLIYKGDKSELNSGKVCLIPHHKSIDSFRKLYAEEYEIIDTNTSDYRAFVNNILGSSLVVSSSLHGIILAESYGVPAIFFEEGEYIPRQRIKFFDWYESTNRYDIPIAHSVNEALSLIPPAIPDLTTIVDRLVSAFPYDLWMAK